MAARVKIVRKHKTTGADFIFYAVILAVSEIVQRIVH